MFTSKFFHKSLQYLFPDQPLLHFQILGDRVDTFKGMEVELQTSKAKIDLNERCTSPLPSSGDLR